MLPFPESGVLRPTLKRETRHSWSKTLKFKNWNALTTESWMPKCLTEIDKAPCLAGGREEGEAWMTHKTISYHIKRHFWWWTIKYISLLFYSSALLIFSSPLRSGDGLLKVEDHPLLSPFPYLSSVHVHGGLRMASWWRQGELGLPIITRVVTGSQSSPEGSLDGSQGQLVSFYTYACLKKTLWHARFWKLLLIRILTV